MTQARRLLFPLPTFSQQQPLTEHPFYAWLVHNEDRLDTRHHAARMQYLATLGFDIRQHRLSEEDITTLKYVEDIYGSLWMPTRTPQRLVELFIPATKGDSAFWLSGVDTMDKVTPTPALTNLIEATGPIYPLAPEHYYFELSDTTLLLRYQQIIGSRRLCEITAA